MKIPAIGPLSDYVHILCKDGRLLCHWSGLPDKITAVVPLDTVRADRLGVIWFVTRTGLELCPDCFQPWRV